MNNKLNTTGNEVQENECKTKESMFTEMYTNRTLYGVRNFFITALFMMFLGSIVQDMSREEKIMLGLRYILIGFGQIHIAVLLWCCMLLGVVFIHPVICFWDKIRVNLKFTLKSCWDQFCLLLLLLFLSNFFYHPVYYTRKFNLPIATSFIVITEQVRMLMKMHAYIRSIVPRVLYKNQNQILPSFQQYLYFLFAPTLVYKDVYPRTQNIRWKFVFINFAQVIAFIFYMSLLTSQYLEPKYKDFGLKPYNLTSVLLLMFENIISSSTILFISQYILLHCWMNAFAEMLKFGEREFYSDWWNTHSFIEFYRKWNTLVHNYLHTYIYRDVVKILVPGNRVIGIFCVLFTSSFFHEYILVNSLGIFIPLLFVQFFTFGQILLYVQFPNHFTGNTFIWSSLVFGFGMDVTAYAIEYCTRLNCPSESKVFSDYFIPRIMSYCK